MLSDVISVCRQVLRTFLWGSLCSLFPHTSLPTTEVDSDLLLTSRRHSNNPAPPSFSNLTLSVVSPSSFHSERTAPPPVSLNDQVHSRPDAPTEQCSSLGSSCLGAASSLTQSLQVSVLGLRNEPNTPTISGLFTLLDFSPGHSSPLDKVNVYLWASFLHPFLSHFAWKLFQERWEKIVLFWLYPQHLDRAYLTVGTQKAFAKN